MSYVDLIAFTPVMVSCVALGWILKGLHTERREMQIDDYFDRLNKKASPVRERW